MEQFIIIFIGIILFLCGYLLIILYLQNKRVDSLYEYVKAVDNLLSITSSNNDALMLYCFKKLLEQSIQEENFEDAKEYSQAIQRLEKRIKK